MNAIEIDGARINYRFDGRAEAPVVLLANSLGTNLAMWNDQISSLTRSFRVLRYDMRGHGASTATPGPYSIERLAQDALALLDALRIERVHFCGLSMGGMVGMWLGAHAPERIGRLVLCSTGAQVGTIEVWNERIRAVRQRGMAAIAESVLERWFTAAFRECEAAAVDRIRQMLLATSPEGYAAASAAVRDIDQRESVKRIAVPTLVVAGTHDSGTPPAMGQFLVQCIAGAGYVELPAAHLSNIEAAAGFNQAVFDFLSVF